MQFSSDWSILTVYCSLIVEFRRTTLDSAALSPVLGRQVRFSITHKLPEIRNDDSASPSYKASINNGAVRIFCANIFIDCDR